MEEKKCPCYDEGMSWHTKISQKADEERRQLIALVHKNIEYRLPEINEWLGKSFVEMIDKGVEINELDHSMDPEWDHSGELVHTGEYVSPDSDMTLYEFLELPIGMSPSYMSGCGMFPDSLWSDWEIEYNNKLLGIMNETIDQIMDDESYAEYLDYIRERYNVGTKEEIFSLREGVTDDLSDEAVIDYTYDWLAQTDFREDRMDVTVKQLYEKYKGAAEVYQKKMA